MASPEHLQELFNNLALDDNEAANRLEMALSRDYWQRIAPLAIESSHPDTSAWKDVDELAVAGEEKRLRESGYFMLPALMSTEATSRLAAAYDLLKRHGWPVAFAFVFDDAWHLYRHPVLIQFLRHVLGEGYRAMSRIWAHYVPARDGAAGWTPHYDGRDLAERVTTWISLTAATIDNGCIHLVPKSALGPELNAAVFRRGLGPHELARVLQAVKAVPTAPGQVIGWSFDLLHWGSTSASGTSPRLSLALEFIGGGAEPLEQELPLLDVAAGMPTFEQRLFAIGAAILSYDRFDLWAKRFVPLGRLLTARP